MKFLRTSRRKPSKDATPKEPKDTTKKSLSLPNLDTGFKSIEKKEAKPDADKTKKEVPKVDGVEPKTVFSLAAAATAAASANVSAEPKSTKATGAIQDLCAGSDSEFSHVMFEDKSQEGLSTDIPLKQVPEAAPAPVAAPPPPPEPLQLESSASGAFRPPIEVTIDPQGIPPSPLRDNNADFPYQDKGDLLSNSVEEYRKNASPVAGAPQGDIGMRTQLWDAQRLVRVILGKPQASEKPLETGSILQAIRAFAVMKQELILLRQQQEKRDGDPPAILETLGSPTNTTQASSSMWSFANKQPSGGGGGSLSSETKGGHKGVVEAAKKIQSLERQLHHATVTIHKLQQQNTENKITELQQSRVEAQRELAQTKFEKERLEIHLRDAKKQCSEMEKKYKNLLRQFGEFQDFKSREFEGELAKTTAQIEELRKQLHVKETGEKEHELFTAHLAEMEKKMADPNQGRDHSDELDWKAEQRALREELAQARLAIEKKDEIIRDLQDSQTQLQNRVTRVLDDLQSRKGDSTDNRDENAHSKRTSDREADESVLKEVQRNKFSHDASGSQTKATSQRLQSLQEEHRALVATIQILEEEMKLGT